MGARIRPSGSSPLRTPLTRCRQPYVTFARHGWRSRFEAEAPAGTTSGALPFGTKRGSAAGRYPPAQPAPDDAGPSRLAPVASRGRGHRSNRGHSACMSWTCSWTRTFQARADHPTRRGVPASARSRSGSSAVPADWPPGPRLGLLVREGGWRRPAAAAVDARAGERDRTRADPGGGADGGRAPVEA